MYKNFFKGFIDKTLALVAITVISPVFLILTVVLYFVNGGKPFFIQARPGKNGHLFNVIKFKTMTDKRDVNGELLPDDARITSIGAIVRQSSLDEVPQLINVIKGDMSLVGPRPLLPEYLESYNSFQERRHEVKPGITGWAQVNGRNAISWEQKFAYDIWYVDNISIGLDVRIMMLTVGKIFRRDGINQDAKVTMSKFKGNN
ncbi:MAG: sugar transferase [Sphingobacteriaceae bacterium]|jgi:lipopolysaccharide/colanic/teichoic acid biosynthesis glycosyltransferase|nr:sugar transferase [Sphingobacteriaceae bacterium]